MKAIIKRYIPPIILNYLRELYIRYLIYTQPRRHRKALKRLQRKDKIKVAFFATHSSVWKYDYLYRLMVKHSRFEPIIIVCPVVNYGMENMLQEMDKCYNMFHSRKYNVIRSYNVDTQEYLDVKTEINPDIIFYTNPYKAVVDNRYYITKFLDTLTCYVPYSVSVCSINSQYRKEMHYLVWKFFVENTLSYNLACQLMANNGDNTQVIGYPSMDEILSSDYIPKNVWKHEQRIKIIWAPHHTIDSKHEIHFSNFFVVFETMLDIAQKYADKIQIAFKPHPLLYPKLLNVWGKDKTDAYYKQWESMPNTQYEANEYINLFMTSDAMIFDSVSFIHEYLFTQKRSLFIYGSGIDEQLNDFGKEALSCHQLAYDIKDIHQFVNSLISNGIDPLLNRKEKYYENYILPPNTPTASEAILNEIINHTK